MIFVDLSQREEAKPTATLLSKRCSEFVRYRNDALGHGALRKDDVYERDVCEWLVLISDLLDAVAKLHEWQLCLVTDAKHYQAWMGPDFGFTNRPGSFAEQHVGHFVMLKGQGESPEHDVLDLYPFICLLPDADQNQRVHFYDSIYQYRGSRKEVMVLEYDNGFRQPSEVPVVGLEKAFGSELLSRAKSLQLGRISAISRRVVNFGDLIAAYADIVGRRAVIDYVSNFIADHDRGVLVIEGQPGKGKTAIIAHVTEVTFGHQFPPPVHFFYRRTAGVTDPDLCVRSLYAALLEAHGIVEAEGAQQEPNPDAMFNKLVTLLNDQVAPRLSPLRPQIILIDALDESATTATGKTAFQRLPESIPAGVYVIAMGNVTAVENGVITLQTPKEAVTRRVVDLTAKQALTYAAVAARDDERSRLAEAIFRIAESEDPALADKALAAAGNPPGLACYKDRLAALTLGAAEVAARKAWAEIEAAAKPKPTKAEAARFLALLDAFDKAHAGTKHFASVRDKLPALREKAGATTEAAEPAVPPADIPPERAGEIGLEQGFVAAYYAGRDHDRFVTAEAAKQRLSFNWDTKAPAPGVPADFFSCRFVGWLYVDEPADYGFAFWNDDGVRLYVDGKSVVDYWVAKPGHSPTGRIQLEKGWHRLWVEHFDGPWTATISLLWRKGQAAETNVPAEVLYCESELLERVRRNPARNPLLGMKPTDRARLSKPKPGAEQPNAGEWQSLFDAKTLDGWKAVEQFDVPAGDGTGVGGKVRAEDGKLVIEAGRPLSGIASTGEMPRQDYEVSLEAMKLSGGDTFCVIQFPAGSSQCNFVCTWGSELVGFECIDGLNPPGSPVTRRMTFERDKWYQVRLRVAANRLQAWIDDGKVADLPLAGHRFTVPNKWLVLKPFGLGTGNATSAAFRSIRLRRIEPGAAEAPKAGEWQGLFDGKSLEGWQHVKLPQANTGKAYVEDGRIVLDMVRGQGNVVAWQGDFPTTNYEVEFEVTRLAGEQLCNVVFPIGRSRSSLNLGDMARNAGLDTVDGLRAWENLTATAFGIQHGRQYACRLRVTDSRIGVWVDKRQLIDVPIAGHRFSVHELFAGIKGFALGTWNTGSAFSNIRLRRIEQGAAEAPKGGE